MNKKALVILLLSGWAGAQPYKPETQSLCATDKSGQQVCFAPMSAEEEAQLDKEPTAQNEESASEEQPTCGGDYEEPITEPTKSASTDNTPDEAMVQEMHEKLTQYYDEIWAKLKATDLSFYDIHDRIKSGNIDHDFLTYLNARAGSSINDFRFFEQAVDISSNEQNPAESALWQERLLKASKQAFLNGWISKEYLLDNYMNLTWYHVFTPNRYNWERVEALAEEALKLGNHAGIKGNLIHALVLQGKSAEAYTLYLSSQEDLVHFTDGASLPISVTTLMDLDELRKGQTWSKELEAFEKLLKGE